MAVTIVKAGPKSEVEKIGFDQEVCRAWHRCNHSKSGVGYLEGWIRGFSRHQKDKHPALREELALLIKVARGFS